MIENRKSIALDSAISIGVWTLAFSLLLLAILQGAERFCYTLDDPYIHLAVAEEIAHGNYGVNPGEISAPSSSIIWPFLLAPFARLPQGDFAPLVLNYFFGFATILVVLSRLRKLIPDSDGRRLPGTLTRVVITLSVMLVSNGLGLAFTGMEHSLQVLTAIAAIDAIFAIAFGEKLTKRHLIAIVIGPWVRYENLAILAAVGLFFLLERRWKLALHCGLISIAGVALFSFFLASNGLDPVPASVIAKSSMTQSDAGLLGRIPDQINSALSLSVGVCLSLLVVVLVALGFVRKPTDSLSKAALAVAIAGVLHILFGSYGWFNRYEPYILASVFYCVSILIISIYTSHIRHEPLRIALIFPLVSTIIAFPYITSTMSIPAASYNIYEQQFQMHRFITEVWKQPTAVNDLGWTSFRNEEQILDLYGLASPEALELRLSDSDDDWMVKITEKNQIKLVMIYSEWFPTIPKHWEKVASLYLSTDKITPASSEVSFYATSHDAADELSPLLKEFKATISPSQSLRILSDE